MFPKHSLKEPAYSTYSASLWVLSLLCQVNHTTAAVGSPPLFFCRDGQGEREGGEGG